MQVFEATHRLIFELVDSAAVAGLRIDHVDGLADPGTYLRRMRARLPNTPFWIEKILAADEVLPDWPIAGTTGYDLARNIGQLLTDGNGARQIVQLYRRATRDELGFPAHVRMAKREMLESSLLAELWWLQDLLTDASRQDTIAVGYGPESWRQRVFPTRASTRLSCTLSTAARNG